MPARVVAIGGLDPTGGAGLVRDHATAAALGAPLVAIATALTRQGLGGARAARPAFEARPVTTVVDDLRDALGVAPATATAVKLGMVATAALARALAAALSDHARAGLPVVFDPVLASSSGLSLFEGDPGALAPLVARATVTTPNLAELAALACLAGPAVARATPPPSCEEAATLARALVRGGHARALLVKGGHLAGDPVDLLVTRDGETRFAHARIPGRDPRGTGCALATALAIALARGQPLAPACGEAIAWMHARIAVATRRADGSDWLP